MSVLEQLKKLGHLKSSYIFIIAIGTCLLPVIFPLGIGTIPGQYSKAWLDVIKANEGKPVCYVADLTLANWIENLPDYSVIMKTLMKYKCKIIIWSDLSMDVKDSMDKLFKQIRAKEDFGYKYGEDYVVLGYRAGGPEIAFAAVSADFWGVFPNDVYGNKIETLPLMKNIRTMRDVPVGIYHYGAGPYVQILMRQWYTPYGTKIIPWTLPGAMPESMAYIGPDRPIPGILVGKMGTAELEVLTGFKGEATTLQDGMGMLLIGVIVIVVFANISYLAEGKRPQKR